MPSCVVCWWRVGGCCHSSPNHPNASWALSNGFIGACRVPETPVCSVIRGLGGGLLPCHWLASARRGGSSQSPAASCGVCLCLSIFFFLPLVKRGTAEPQTALSAEKEAITFKKLGVAGGWWSVCVCVVWGVTCREPVPAWGESCWGGGWRAGLKGWGRRRGRRLGDQGWWGNATDPEMMSSQQ